MKICIDAGHGGKDPGAVAFDLKEKDANLDIALKIRDILKQNQFDVYMTRKEDITLPLCERADIRYCGKIGVFPCPLGALTI